MLWRRFKEKYLLKADDVLEDDAGDAATGGGDGGDPTTAAGGGAAATGAGSAPGTVGGRKRYLDAAHGLRHTSTGICKYVFYIHRYSLE